MSDQGNGLDEPQESPASASTPATESSSAAGAAVAEASSWPTSAKTATVILALVAVLGVIGAIVGFSQASSSDDDKSSLEAEVDAAEERAASAEQARDDSAAEVEAVATERDDALAESEKLAGDLAAETERADAAEATIADAEAQIEEARAAADEARAEIEEGGGLFPFSIDSSLIPDDLPGNYSITFAEAYCDGFPTCGTLPTQNQARIYFTDEQFLRVEVPGILDAGLFALDGSLYGITDSFTALPQCDGADQRARVTVTLYARGITLDVSEETVARAVDSLNASVTIDAPRTSDTCPSGLVFYASAFTPTG